MRGLPQSAWTDWTKAIAFSINTTATATIGVTPFSMIYGQEAAIPLDILTGPPSEEEMSVEKYILTHSMFYVRQYLTAAENYTVYQRRAAAKYNDTFPLDKTKPLKGQKVWLWSPYRRKGTSGNLSSRWTGPWEIIQYHPPALLVIKTMWLHLQGKNEITRQVVADKIKQYYDNVTTAHCQPNEDELPEDDDPDGEDPIVDISEFE